MELRKKKILLFTDWYEPGFKAGGPIQSCSNIVRNFSAAYSFYIVTSDRDFGELTPYPDIKTGCWTELKNGAQVWYAAPGSLTGGLLKNMLRAVQPDIVYFNSMFSFPYTLRPWWTISRSGFTGKMVLAPRGMLHSGAMLQKTWKKKIFLRLLALSGLSRKVCFHATDEQEVLDIQQYFGKADIVLAGNIPGLDTAPWQQRTKAPGQLRCVTISRVHPKKNIHYAVQRLAAMNPSSVIHYDVYGLVEDERYASQCLQLANNAKDRLKLEFKGPLPRAALFETLHNYHLFLLPTLGENFGHAIFEAMSAGCPVLISDQTPWKELEKHNAGWVRPLSDTTGFVEVMKKMQAMDEQAFNRMSQDARNYAKAFYDQSDFSEKYLRLFS